MREAHFLLAVLRLRVFGSHKAECNSRHDFILSLSSGHTFSSNTGIASLALSNCDLWQFQHSIVFEMVVIGFYCDFT